jgi:hypothetical protein
MPSFQKKIGLPRGMYLAIKYLNQYHSGEHQNPLNSLDVGSVIPDLIRDRHDECFLSHCPLNIRSTNKKSLVECD